MHEWKQECRHIGARGGKCTYYDGVCCTNEYPGGCFPIVEECKTAGLKADGARIPCTRIHGDMCNTYINPKAIWHSSSCPFAGSAKEEGESKKINPLKASKRAAKGKKD